MKELASMLSMVLIASLYPAYGEEPFTCSPDHSDETVVYCNDFNAPNSPREALDYADLYVYDNTSYSGAGSATYTSQRTVEIVGLNLTPGTTANTNGVYKDEEDPNNKYALGLYTNGNQTALSKGSDIMGFVFDVKDPQGNIYDNIQVEFDVAPGFLTYGMGQLLGVVRGGSWPIWDSGEEAKFSVALFDGEKTLSVAYPPAIDPPLISDALDSNLLIGGTTKSYTGSLTAPIQNYPVNFTTVKTTLSTKGLVDPDGKVTLLISLDNAGDAKNRYVFADNLKIITTNRANPGGDVSSVPSLTLVPLLILITLFGLLVPYRLRRRS